MLRRLIADGAEADVADADGRTPLHLAARSGSVDVARVLLEAGADPNRPDRYGHTPLLFACTRTGVPPGLVAALREHGADPYRANDAGATPRDHAAYKAEHGEPDPLADLPLPERKPKKTEAGELSDAEMELVVAAVRAVVERDEVGLRRLGAYKGGGDPYTWVDEYMQHKDAPDRLVMPDGDPRSWPMHVYRSDEGDWVGPEVTMWTEQEGESDFTLRLGIWVEPDRTLRAEFRDLLVL